MTTNAYTKLFHIKNEIKETSDYNHLETSKLLSPLLEKHKLTLALNNDPKSFIHEKFDGEHVIKYLKKIEIADKENSNNKLSFNFWAVGNNVDSDKAKTNAENCTMESMFRGLFLISPN